MGGADGRGASAALGTAAAAVALAGVAGAAYAYGRAAAAPLPPRKLLLFLDDPVTGLSRNGVLLLLSADAELDAARSAAASALGLPTPPELYLLDSKLRLTHNLKNILSQAAADSVAWRGAGGVLPIAAVQAGAALSDDAARLPPLAAPSHGPRPLPIIANAGILTRPYDAPMYSVWHHLHRPHLIERWGETVAYALPEASEDFGTLGVGPTGHVDERWVGVTVLSTCDPDVLGELLERQPDFPKTWTRAPERALTRLAGTGIFTSSTESTDWQTVHGIFPRAFNPLKVAAEQHPIIVAKTAAFVGEWGRLPPGSLLTGVNDWLGCMTSDAVILSSCNVDMGNVARRGRGEPVHPLLDSYRKVGKLQSGPPGLVWPGKRAAREKEFVRLKSLMEGLVEDVVESTRRGELGNTLLAALVGERSPTNGLFVRQRLLFGQFINLLVAGHETTANTMGFLMYYLSQNPSWEEALRKEIRTVLDGRDSLAATDLPKLVVAEACFKETLRMHPPAGQVGRDAKHDTILQGRYLVRRGQRVSVNLVALHRNPRHWPEPLTWNPARFLPGPEAAARHPHAWKPFGFGMRACAGMNFALWEAKVLIPMLYHHFTFKLVEGFKLNPSRLESFPSPSAEGLAFYINPAPGAPPPPAPGVPYAKPLGGAAPAAVAPAAPPAAAAPGSDDSASNKRPLTIAFGSNSGTCEAFAGQVMVAARSAGYTPSLTDLDSLLGVAGARATRVTVPSGGTLLVVTSTYNGSAPDNASALDKWIAAACAGGPGAGDGAKGIQYAVLGVGNSSWQTYQAYPHRVDDGLAALGAARLAPMTAVDTELPGFVDAVTDWWAALAPALGGHAASKSGTAAELPMPRLRLSPAPSGTKPVPMSFVLEQLREARALAAAAAAAAGGELPPTAAAFGYNALEITAAQQLQAPDSGRATRHVEVQLPEGMEYEPGDHLEVLPRNAHALVATALRLLGMNGDEVWLWTPGGGAAAARGAGGAGGGAANAAWTGPPLPVRSEDILAWLMDLAAVPSRNQLAALAEACPCPPEAAALRGLVAAPEVYAESVARGHLSVLQLLEKHASLLAGMDLLHLTALLPRLAPRYYSISSSPDAPGGSRRATITVGLVEETTPSGRLHQGPASTTIHEAKVGSALVGTVRRVKGFRLPADPATPLIMVGPGTGIAPMIGFLEHRQAAAQAGAVLGPAHLFFGCRSKQADFLYRDRLEGWKDSGVLTDLHVALSRQPGQAKVYVQDLLRECAGELWPLLQAGAVVYVCGDARSMAPAVRAALAGVAADAGGMGAAGGEAWLEELRTAGRLLEDVWAS